VSNTAAKQIFAILEAEDAEPRLVAEREGLLQVSDDGALVAWVDEVLAEMPAEAARFLAGEKKLQGVLVGAVMKKSKGSADPKKVNQILAGRVGCGVHDSLRTVVALTLDAAPNFDLEYPMLTPTLVTV
jgi:aspartyl-tRNA(Asn)/glutamyl-tRNA(Gln) amidotransferase subunit B